MHDDRAADYVVVMPDDLYDDATLHAIGDLLALGEREGFGITFTPDAEGWTVGYMRGNGGGELLIGYDLGDTVRGSLRPLAELAAEYRARAAEREKER